MPYGKSVFCRTFGDDECLELALLGCTLHDLAFDRVPADQPKDKYGSRLPDTVCSILCLQVHLRILSKYQSIFRSIRLSLKVYAPNPGRRIPLCRLR